MRKLEVPDPVTEVGDKVALAPLGRPPKLKLTLSANPPERVTVTVDDAPCPGLILAEAGDIESEKSGVAGA